MAVGGFFLLLVVVVIVAVIGAALWAIRAGLWAKETSPKGDSVEGAPDAGRRPEHTTVDEPGNQSYVGTRRD